jgi:hypothetical protein
MRRVLSIACVAWWTSVASAGAIELPERVPVDLHGRVETVVEVDEQSAPFSWNDASRSPFARSRLMAGALAGSDRLGFLYLKGSASWKRFDTSDDRVPFEFDQGDYVWSRSYVVRIFANERRYFTSSLGPTLLDDDVLERYGAHGGVRADGRVRGRLSWSVLGALLDDESDQPRRVGYASARWHGAHAQGALSYLSDVQKDERYSDEDHAVVKGEVAGFYRKLTGILSYEQSGFDDRPLFLPRGGFDWDGYVGSNFTETMPQAGAAFAELRVRELPFRRWGRIDAVHRYQSTGSEFVDDLASRTPGEVSSTTGLYFQHRDLALDARVLYAKRVRWHYTNSRQEQIRAHAHAFLKNGSELLLRGAVGYREDDRAHRTNENFVHAALRRSMQKVEVGVHAMVKDIDEGEFDRRFGLETRVNWSARVSMYGRLVANEEAASNDAEYVRLELRPTGHVFVTVAYGRSYIGDAPYLLEDDDIGATGDAEDVYTITVRGDF